MRRLMVEQRLFGIYTRVALMDVLFVPIVFGIFVKNIKFVAALTGSLTALIVYYSVYYLLPELVQSGIADLGYFNLYLSDKVQNPALAASLAIVLSLISGFLVHLFTKNTKQIS